MDKELIEGLMTYLAGGGTVTGGIILLYIANRMGLLPSKNGKKELPTEMPIMKHRQDCQGQMDSKFEKIYEHIEKSTDKLDSKLERILNGRN